MKAALTENLLSEIDELKNRLAEAEQLIEAIKAGEVDAFAFTKNNKPEIFTLESGDYAYRILVENLSEGALNLSEDGLIVYTNNYFHELLHLSYEKVISTSIFDYIHSSSKETFTELFKKGLAGLSKGEINLSIGKKIIPVYVSLTSLYPKLPTVGMIVTDLTEKKEGEKMLVQNKKLEHSKKMLEESEQRYYHLIHSSPSAIGILYGKDLIITIANDPIIAIWGKGKEIIGKKYFEALPELAEQGYKEVFAQVYKTGIPFNAIETPVHILQNGVTTLKYYNFVLYPQRNINNEIDGIGIIATEVTSQAVLNNKIKESEKQYRELSLSLEEKVKERTAELQKINEVLRFSEERYHRMIEEVQDYSIILLSKEGIIQNWNKGAENIKGYKAEEIIGKSFSAFYTSEDLANQIPEKLLSIATEKGKATDENWRVRKDGSRFWSSVVITALHDNKNNIIGFVKVTRDLTERKDAEDKLKQNASLLEQKNIDLEKMNNELQSFAYISSHDLQEPLRKIQTFATRILEKENQNLSDYGKEHFKRMQAAANRMQKLIDDLLAYSRTNTAERVFEKTNLNKIIEEVKEDLKEDIQEKQATIETTELGELNIIPFQFHQLIYNIISNSLKYSGNAHSPHIKIKGEISNGIKLNNEKLSPQNKYCHISISDNGIGFEQQYSEKIFEVFQRLHGKTEYEGTGIGLAIAKKIVENHNGIITASGVPDKGAVFEIYIPAT